MAGTRPAAWAGPIPGIASRSSTTTAQPVPAGATGEVALHRRDIHGHADPVFFLEYWRNPEATARKFSGDWCRTGDLASVDAEGYLWYQGRADDMFKAAGYRIGPSEIENCLIKHPAVANVAVVPKPDAERGAVVKAFVVLAAAMPASPALVDELQQHVRGKLAPYEYPKEIEFIDALADDDHRKGAATGAARSARRLARTRPEPPSRAPRRTMCEPTHDRVTARSEALAQAPEIFGAW